MAVTRDGKGNVVPESQAYVGNEQQTASRRPLSSRSFGSPLISSPVCLVNNLILCVLK